MSNRVQATNTVIVKLRPSGALRAAESRANLRPLYESAQPATAFGLGGEPRWFLAELPDGAATPWDLAHARVADQLGIAESDVVFAEPDIIHDIYLDANEIPGEQRFAIGQDCSVIPQDKGSRKKAGPDKFAWHLDDEYTQLGSARENVQFTQPRTRVGHLDTGYYRRHVTTPARVLVQVERNFVKRDAQSDSAEDPDNRVLLVDSSGHGTGTVGILAGGMSPDSNGVLLGGAPDAEVLPLRIADSVVLLRTSAFAEALHYAVDQRCDVVTMSMGGLPSRAWRDAVDRAYLGGLCVVAAAGNNANGLPTRNVVYPARYGRVIAVCGVMADDTPYHHLKGLRTIEGNYGPRSVMESAMAAYTPNIPWPRYGCPDAVRRNGEGTSAATPQVAAAAALWFEKYKTELPRDWRRVEAVRNALFSSARKIHKKELGHGVLRASDALRVRPVLGLPQTKADSDWLAPLRVLTGLGLAEPPTREQMFNLEFMQRWLVSPELQKLLPDPKESDRLDKSTLKKVMGALIEDEGTSTALRRHLVARYPVAVGARVPRTRRSEKLVPEDLPACDAQPAVPSPPHRRLRVYAVDPSLATRLDTAGINELTLKVRWEPLAKGPVGEYLSVEDVDATKSKYEPVDLDDPLLLAQDGWAPSEGNPQFHQQMVYAVAMKTIEHFELGLGRPVLWRPGLNPERRGDDSIFARHLTIRPHALRQANAFYSPDQIALSFGYFEAGANDPARLMPRSRIYTCLSHDIIVHETTHAILDGMHRRFSEPTNPDVLALHEAFADIVALMQHFTIPEILESEIARTRGDIEAESMLGSLAVQFGYASGRSGALRDAIGRIENGKWKRLVSDPAELQKRLTPHTRGALLVAAVFDAFIAIYKTRIADLLRLYTGGTGVLPEGSIHPDLVRRLANEARKAALHVLNICIRALDYLPPVDVTFFEYLRALITADSDVVRDDRLNYRVAFVEAFRKRGIYPVNLKSPSADTPRTLSVDTLKWKGLDWSKFHEKQTRKIGDHYKGVIEELKRYADACLYLKDREQLFRETRKRRKELHNQLRAAFAATPEFATELRLDPEKRFEVHELRRAMRVSPDGMSVPQVIVIITQSISIPRDRSSGTPAYRFRGGSTLVLDLSALELKYRIFKDINSQSRRDRTAAFVSQAMADPLKALFFGPDRKEPFAALHALAEDGM